MKIDPPSSRQAADRQAKQKLRIGWLIDGRGGPVLPDQLVVIAKGRIQSIEPFCGSSGSAEDVVDLTHSTILPALMDAHVHLALSGTLNETQRLEQLRQTPQQAQQNIQKHLYAHLDSGIIAVRDAGDRLGQALKARDGPATPVHLSATCWAWHAPNRYGGMIGRAPSPGESLAQAIARCAAGTDHVKLIQSGINSLDCFGHQTPPQFTETELIRVRQWASARGLPVMVHANGQAAVQIALAAGCDSIEHGYFMGSDNLHRLADHEVYWVPTVAPMAVLSQAGVVSSSQTDVARQTVDHQLDQISKAYHAGVLIALGTDAGSMGVDHGTAVRRELALLMNAGLSTSQGVQCATANAARLMRLKNQGALRPGWRADFIVVPGGPENLLVGLEAIQAICIQGDWR